MNTIEFQDYDLMNQFINDEALAFNFEQNLFSLAEKQLSGYSGGLWKAYRFDNGGVCAVPPVMDHYELATFSQHEAAKFGSGDTARLACGLAMTQLLLNWIGNHRYQQGKEDQAQLLFDCAEVLYTLIDEKLFSDQNRKAHFLFID